MISLEISLFRFFLDAPLQHSELRLVDGLRVVPAAGCLVEVGMIFCGKKFFFIYHYDITPNNSKYLGAVQGQKQNHRKLETFLKIKIVSFIQTDSVYSLPVLLVF